MTFDSLRSRLPQTWLDFANYVRRPALLAPVGLRAGWRAWLAMLALDTAGLIILLPVLSGWQKLAGIGEPEAFSQFPKEYLFVAAAVIAPVAEEALFRGALSGRPRAFWLLGCTIAFFAAFVLMAPHAAEAAALLGFSLLLAAVGWFLLRRSPTQPWFVRRFSWIFYASALVFGLVHVLNYGSPALKLIPMVLPQLWAGLSLGYTRMRVGLPGSMLLHASANALALGLVAAGI